MTRGALLLVVLAWTAPPTACMPMYVKVWDAYIEGGTGIGNAAIGSRLIGPWQTTITVASGKPDMPDCAIGWGVTAVDIDGNELGPECQPTNITADGQMWEGM